MTSSQHPPHDDIVALAPTKIEWEAFANHFWVIDHHCTGMTLLGKFSKQWDWEKDSI